tara:strand:+ start:682 stop:1095 length:414 start_codon:yes stop_codon:yes gene_type:complete
MNLTNKTKANIVFYIHLFLTTVNILLPLVLPKKYLKFGLLFALAIIIHWVIFDGCILTIIEHKYSKEPLTTDHKGQFLDRAIYKLTGLDLNETQLRYLTVSVTIFVVIIYSYRLTRNILITYLLAAITGVYYVNNFY